LAKKKKKLGLTSQIVIAMFLGVLVGVFINTLPAGGFSQEYLVDGLFTVVGKIFVKSLKMLVVPIVFVSLVCGVCSLKDISALGRVGGRTLMLYMLTTALAIGFAIAVSSFVNPGIGFDLPTNAEFLAKEAPPLSQVIINIFPSNPLDSMAKGNMLQIIVFAILFGLATVMVGPIGNKITSIFNDLNEIFMKLIGILMLVAPYGVFCLIAQVFATQGFSAIAPLAKYFFVVIGALIIHAGFTYPLLLTLLSKLNPITFFKKVKDPVVFAFSTASSNATLPVTLETVEHKLGVKNSIASFTIPLGATINMDGTAIMQGCATVFISQAYNIQLGLTEYLTVIVTATLASIGTAGVPGVGLITLAMVLRQVGLPVEGIALIIGVDRILDMCRTAVNIVGDTMVTCVVAKREGQIDQKVYDDLSL